MLKWWVGGFRAFLAPCAFICRRGITMDEYIARDIELYGLPSQVIGAVLESQSTGPVPPSNVAGTSVAAVDETSGNDPTPDDDLDSVIFPQQTQQHVDTPTVSADVFDSLLQDAHFQNSRGHFQHLPWKSGVFASIFRESSSSLTSVLNVCPVPPESLQVSDDTMP